MAMKIFIDNLCLYLAIHVYVYIYYFRIYIHVHVYYEKQLKNLVDTYFVFTFIEAKIFYLPIILKVVKKIASGISNGN